VLVHHPAELAFKEPVKLLQDHNRLASLVHDPVLLPPTVHDGDVNSTTR
jgi:hypothetical protein